MYENGLPFVWDKSPEMMCSPEVISLSLFDSEISQKDLELVYLKWFEMNWQQIYRGQVLMLDRWKACLYMIILSLHLCVISDLTTSRANNLN